MIKKMMSLINFDIIARIIEGLVRQLESELVVVVLAGVKNYSKMKLIQKHIFAFGLRRRNNVGYITRDYFI